MAIAQIGQAVDQVINKAFAYYLNNIVYHAMSQTILFILDLL